MFFAKNYLNINHLLVVKLHFLLFITVLYVVLYQVNLIQEAKIFQNHLIFMHSELYHQNDQEKILYNHDLLNLDKIHFVKSYFQKVHAEE